MIRLYRFYNLDENAEGEPFGMCDEHKATYKVPSDCVMIKIANDSMMPCNLCDHGYVSDEPPRD